MPLYEYQCEACGARFEQLRRMAEADRGVECPKCESAEVKRTLSTFASRVAGGGAGAAAPCGAPASSCGSGRFT
jgi:putative FmdB family regulatory protein